MKAGTALVVPLGQAGHDVVMVTDSRMNSRQRRSVLAIRSLAGEPAAPARS